VSDPSPPGDCVCDLGLVRIRRKRVSDALDDYHWQRDPELARLNATPPYTGSYSSFLEVFESRRLFPGDSGAFSIETVDGVHIGNVMYYNANSAGGAAEFGITIGHSAFRGAGIGTAVTVAFLRLLWQTTPLRRMELHALDWNERAIRSFRKAGFEECARVIRANGDVLMRMEVRREWWLLWDAEGRFTQFDRIEPLQGDDPAAERAPSATVPR